MKITNPYKDLEDWQDGDWTVRFCFEEFSVSTAVIATTEEQAIRYAEGKIPLDKLGECLEIDLTLCGVYQ